MSAYYNEFDPYAAAWLRNLIATGQIAPGDVDERSIADVSPDDLRGYTQCHFFAGIGGWSLAMRMARWADERAVWTGSCPCQPFSDAGARQGEADERHLWPEFLRLIAERRPPVVFGEQVASRLGRGWLSGVRADLEAVGYAVGGADLCAAGVGAPHIRQRLWWVADADGGYARAEGIQRCGEHGQQPQDDGAGGGVADDYRLRCEQAPESGYADEERNAQPRGGVGHAEHTGLQGRSDEDVPGAGRGYEGGEPPSASGAAHWSNAVWIPCADGKARRIEPGLEPLAHGVPNRVGRLRAYGNAIVPQTAEAFIRAYAGA